MSVLVPAMSSPEAAGGRRALLERLHDWVVTVDHKRLGIIRRTEGKIVNETGAIDAARDESGA